MDLANATINFPTTEMEEFKATDQPEKETDESSLKHFHVNHPNFDVEPT